MKHKKIVKGLRETYSRVELLNAYHLNADSTDYDIAYAAIYWGDANADGTLN